MIINVHKVYTFHTWQLVNKKSGGAKQALGVNATDLLELILLEQKLLRIH